MVVTVNFLASQSLHL